LKITPKKDSKCKKINIWWGSGQDIGRGKMRDYIKRFLIAVIMGLCVSLLFLGVKQSETSMSDTFGKLNYLFSLPTYTDTL
jgi:hypothetical protein